MGHRYVGRTRRVNKIRRVVERAGGGQEAEDTQCNDGRLLVKPGDPGNSYLLQKILGRDMCSGSQMPKAGVSLPAADLEALTTWICQGAPR